MNTRWSGSSSELPRVIRMDDCSNFRELGGYPAAGGRRVRSGILYRSGELCRVTGEKDKAVLNSLGLRVVLDFRSRTESVKGPDFVPEGADYVQCCGMRYENGDELDFSPEGMKRLDRELSARRESGQEAFFASLYTGMAFGNPAFRKLFRFLEEGRVPLLFHCTCGKDRTGAAAMLILLALGASRQTAFEDYMATNRCMAPEILALEKKYPGLAQEDPEKWDRLFTQYGVLRRAGDRLLDAVFGKYDSLETFFYREYGLDEDRLAALRDRYLEA